MSKEVLQEALELLAVATFITPKLQAKRTDVINAGLQALAEDVPETNFGNMAEQPAQQITESPDDWSDWKVIPPQPQPAQQEPVGEVEQIDIDEDGQASAWFRLNDNVELGDNLYTSPPAQRKPLTDEEKDAARYRWLRNPDTDVSLVLDKRTDWVPPAENVSGVGGYWLYEYRAGTELDEAVDRAIEAAHGIKENT